MSVGESYGVRERLQAADSFDDQVIDVVVNVAERQQTMTSWDQYCRDATFPAVEVFQPEHGKSIEVWDRIPAEYDDTLVGYSTSGNYLTPNILFRFSVLAEALPNTRLVVIGSHGGIGKKTGKVALSDLWNVWMGDYTASVEPGMAYLEKQRIEESQQQGYSLGAEKPPVAAQLAEGFNHRVTNMIMLEPTRLLERKKGEQASALIEADKQVAAYQKAAESPVYQNAITSSSPAWIESLPAKMKPLAFLRLFSLTNIAYFGGQTRPLFETQVTTALDKDPELLVATIWGTESNMTLNALMMGVTGRMSNQYGDRSKVIPLLGHTHPLGNDVYLHAAATLQGMRTQ